MVHYGLPGSEVDCEHVDIDVGLHADRNTHNKNFNVFAGADEEYKLEGITIKLYEALLFD